MGTELAGKAGVASGAVCQMQPAEPLGWHTAAEEQDPCVSCRQTERSYAQHNRKTDFIGVKNKSSW